MIDWDDADTFIVEARCQHCSWAGKIGMTMTPEPECQPCPECGGYRFSLTMRMVVPNPRSLYGITS